MSALCTCVNRQYHEPHDVLCLNYTPPVISMEHANAMCKLSTVKGNLMGMQDVVRWHDDGILKERPALPDFDYLDRMINDIDSAMQVFVPQLNE